MNLSLSCGLSLLSSGVQHSWAKVLILLCTSIRCYGSMEGERNKSHGLSVRENLLKELIQVLELDRGTEVYNVEGEKERDAPREIGKEI